MEADLERKKKEDEILGKYRKLSPEEQKEQERKSRPSKKKGVTFFLLAAAALLGSAWILHACIKDAQYLERPREMLLSDIRLHDSADDEHNMVDGIYGTDSSGKMWSFSITHKMKREVRKLPLDYKNDLEKNIKAKVHYLPHTRVLMDLSFTD